MEDLLAAFDALPKQPVDDWCVRVAGLPDFEELFGLADLSAAEQRLVMEDLNLKGLGINHYVERHVRDVFSRCLVSREEQGICDRFSKEKHALYASRVKKTAEMEIRHHASKNWSASQAKTFRVTLYLMQFRFDGLTKNASKLCDDFPIICEEAIVEECRLLGDHASKSVDSLEYVSRRHSGLNRAIYAEYALKESVALERWTACIYRTRNSSGWRVRLDKFPID